MNTAAANYQATATYDPNSTCIFAYPGCMSSTAFNYNPTANVNSGCVPRIPGCMDSRASNYQPGFNTPGPPVCVFLGCMNSLDARYSPIATISDGSCPNAPGCTDPAAANKNAVYNVQLAGSCTYGGCRTVGDTNYNARNTFAIPVSCAGSGRRLEEIRSGRRLQGTGGCLDPNATTYSSSAASHVQSLCTYAILGCTNSTAFNYLALATAGNSQASSSCIARVTGCMSPTALNYNSNANSAGNCTYAVNGCADSIATTFMAAATVHVQSLCAYNIPGCTMPSARNFNPNATVNNQSSCQYNVAGCTDPAATNYVAGANIAVACTYPGISGCMSPTAHNYKPNATQDDGSCEVYSPPPRPPPPSRPPRPPPPPSPPPPPPLRSAATVTVTLVAAGSVSDYNEQRKTNLQIKFAEAAGVRAASTLSFPTPPTSSPLPVTSNPYISPPPSLTTPIAPNQVPPSFVVVQVAAGSVIITAVIAVPVGSTASGVMNALGTTLGSTSAASSFLGITVTSAPTFTATDNIRNTGSSLALPLGLGLGLGLGGCLVLSALFVLIKRRKVLRDPKMSRRKEAAKYDVEYAAETAAVQAVVGAAVVNPPHREHEERERRAEEEAAPLKLLPAPALPEPAPAALPEARLEQPNPTSRAVTNIRERFITGDFSNFFSQVMTARFPPDAPATELANQEVVAPAAMPAESVTDDPPDLSA